MLPASHSKIRPLMNPFEAHSRIKEAISSAIAMRFLVWLDIYLKIWIWKLKTQCLCLNLSYSFKMLYIIWSYFAKIENLINNFIYKKNIVVKCQNQSNTDCTGETWPRPSWAEGTERWRQCWSFQERHNSHGSSSLGFWRKWNSVYFFWNYLIFEKYDLIWNHDNIFI